jgi:hypothetical protein
VDLVLEELVLARPRPIEHADDPEERGLSRARRPHDRDELALTDVEVDASEYPGARRTGVEGLLDAAERDHGGMMR